MEDIRKVEQLICDKLDAIRNKENKVAIDYQRYDELQKQLRIIRNAKELIMCSKYEELLEEANK